ncbi:MAG: serine hydrolase [Clostridia bacterium]|nr:serine hydrolase [Clostridia bacterium]
MKFTKFAKRILCLLLVCATLFAVASCAADDGVESGSGSESGSESSASTNKANSTDIVLSGTPAFRIVYSSAYKSSAEKIVKKLASLDKTPNKYVAAQDTVQAADGTPEIVIGATNRPATEEAKKLVSKKSGYYAIYVTDTAIAVYASAKEGIEAAIDALIKKISLKNGSVVYDNSKGNLTGKYTTASSASQSASATKPVEKPQVAPIAKTTAIAKTDIDATALLNALVGAAGSKAYSVAVSSTDGIQTKAKRDLNPHNTYSVSKVFCVTAIGMLYDEGKIKVTDTIGTIFKDEIKAYGIDENKWKNITIHDVLKHNIGFTQGSLLDIDVYASEWKNWDKDFLKIVLNYKIDGKKTYKYSDAAYYLISRVVAKISGQKLDVYLKSRLFDKCDYKDYTITKCPEGHPIGATQFFLRPEDVVKLGRIYLNGGTYNNQRIISQDWVNQVIDKGYELNSSNNGYGKGGMRGQYLYVNFKHNVAVAWLSETDDGTSALGSKLRSYMT